jgi:hypothetical protein
VKSVLGNFNQMRSRLIAKIHFFKKFLLLFSHRVTRIGNRESRTFFDSNAQVRPAKGNVCFRNAMKRQNTIFTFNFLLLTIFSVSSVCSVAEIQSIKNNKLCETNPISEKPKLNLTFYSIRDYENKSELCLLQR